MIRMLRLVLLLLACWLGQLSLQAQDRAHLDSLMVRSAQMELDSAKVALQYDIAKAYYYAYLDSMSQCYAYARKGIQLARELGHPSLQIQGWNWLGIFSRVDGVYDSSVVFYDQAIALAREHELDGLYYRMLDNQSVNYGFLGREDTALLLKQLALDFFLEEGDSVTISISLNNIGALYQGVEDYPSALSYYLRSIAYLSKDDSVRLSGRWGNAGICYKQMARYDSARIAYQHARQLARTVSTRDYVQATFNLGLLYVEQDSFRQAIAYFESVQARLPELPNWSDYYYYQANLAQSYASVGRLADAERAYQLAKSELENSDNHNYQLRLFMAGYQLALTRGDYRGALDQYRRLTAARDTLRNLDKERAFAEVEARYEAEKKERLIQEQKLALVQSDHRQNQLLLGLLAAVMLGTMAAFWLYRSRQSDRALKEAEIRELQQQHKVSSLRSMLEGQEEERKRIARDLHDNISAMMSALKMKVMGLRTHLSSPEGLTKAQELNALIGDTSAEIRRISHRMTPVALELAGLHGAVSDLLGLLRSQDIRVQANIEALDEVQEQETAIVLFRILQELTNNILKHSQADTVTMQADLDEAQTLQLMVEDNGVGIPPELWQQPDASLGLRSLKSRIAYLNGSLDLLPGPGTRYRIRIPI